MALGASGQNVDERGRASVRLDGSTDLTPGMSELMQVQEVAARADPYRVTADAQVVDGPCYVLGFVATAGTTPTLNLHSGTSTSDPLVYGGSAGHTLGAVVSLPGAIWCPNGLYADVGGTNPAYTVYVLR